MQPNLETFRWLDERASSNTWITARIKPGISHAAAQADLDRIGSDLAREYPHVNDGLKFRLTKPGLLGDQLRRYVEPFVSGVMILAGLVLLAACVNLASMMAARSADRMREIAVRISIGAGRARIVRQLLTESVLLTAIAGVGGSTLAVFALRAFSAWRPPTGIALQVEVEPDLRVFLFAVLVSGLAGLLAGIAPARQAWRSDANAALKGASSVGGRSRRWAGRDLLLAAQVALCCVLVTASFVSLRGLTQALTTRPGFDMDGANAISYDLAMLRYSREDARAFDRRAMEAAAELPGVVAVGYANSIPLSINQSNNAVFRDDSTDFRTSQGISVSHFSVSPGYFAAMGTRLRGGREFRWQDDAKAPAVAIVNETLARRLTGTSDAVGRRVRFGKGAAAEIVAVVEDGKYQSLSEAPHPALFRPALQSFNGESVLIVRSSRDVAAELERLIARLDPALPVDNSGSLKQVLAVAFLPSYLATLALGAFGVLAAMLAVTGIYGIASYSVSRRRREIGIRMAIGARAGDVLRFVLGRTAILVLAGAALGLAGGIAASAVLAKVV
jgi:predicted permease